MVITYWIRTMSCLEWSTYINIMNRFDVACVSDFFRGALFMRYARWSCKPSVEMFRGNRCCLTVSGAASFLVHLSCVIATQQNKIEARLSCRRCSRQSHKARVSLQPTVMHTKHTQASGGHMISGETNLLYTRRMENHKCQQHYPQRFLFSHLAIYLPCGFGALQQTHAQLMSRGITWSFRPAKAMVHDDTTRSQGWCDLSLCGTTST